MNQPPPDVIAFLREHVGTFEHLEVLLLLHGSRDRSWPAEEIAPRTRIGLERVTELLGEMLQGRLIRRDDSAGVTSYCYAPDSDSVEASVDWLARDRREGGLLTVRTLSELAIERVRTSAMRTFSDAFILRKKPLG